MEYNLDSKLIPSEQTCLDTVAEQLVDIDFTLPDYCPDIEKILKCTLTPKIFSRNLSGGQLQIDGVAVVKILYCNSGKKHIRCCEQTVPFSQSFSVKSALEQFIVLTNTKSEYINCRALSPRRLVIHGAFSLYAKVQEKNGVSLCSINEEVPLETSDETIKCARMCAFCQDQFTISEEISVTNKPKIEVLLRDSVKAEITQVKSIPDKLIIKGEINLKLLYLSDLESGMLDQIDYLLPFNQILDSSGVDEDVINDLTLNVLSYDIRLKSDHLSENPILDLDVKILITEIGYKISEETIIKDAYSTEYETEILHEKVPIISDIIHLDETIMHKNAIKIENIEISKVIDIYNEYCTVTASIGDQLVSINGKANVCVIALDQENTPVYIERSIDFEHNMPLESEVNFISSAQAEVRSISYRLTDDNSIELRLEIRASSSAFMKDTYDCVVDVKGIEDKPLQKKTCALTLYYGNKGEKVWDIAKKYNTKLKLLNEENLIDSPILEAAQMLLIPTV